MVGFDGWLSMAANQTDTNIINLAGELKVASKIEAATVGYPNTIVQIGQDSLPGSGSTFDITVIRNGQPIQSIEIRTIQGPVRMANDLRGGIIHAVEKLPGPTTGTKEAGIVANVSSGQPPRIIAQNLANQLNGGGYSVAVQNLSDIAVYDLNGNFVIHLSHDVPSGRWVVLMP